MLGDDDTALTPSASQQQTLGREHSTNLGLRRLVVGDEMVVPPGSMGEVSIYISKQYHSLRPRQDDGSDGPSIYYLRAQIHYQSL